MNIWRSLRGLSQVWADDDGFRKAGRPMGWYVFTHYAARWRDRKGQQHPWQMVKFKVRHHTQSYRLTSEHLGAALGVLVDEEYAAVGRFEGKVSRVLDLGGNVGMGSGYLSTFFPHAEFAVVEPDPRNLAVLSDNLARNGIVSRIFGAAIGSSAGMMSLRVGDNPACSSLQGVELHEMSGAVDVSVMTVPDVMRVMGWQSIDLVKMDIEGAEKDVLSINNQWLNHVGALILEVHPNTTPDFIQAQLAPFSLKMKRVGTGREPVFLAVRN